MSVAEPQSQSLQERRPSPNLSLNLSSNNPFRQRANSPAKGTSASPVRSSTDNRNAPAASTSTNPFSDNYQLPPEFASPPKNDRPRNETNKLEANARNATERLNDLALNDQQPSDLNKQLNSRPGRSETVDAATHRPRRSHDEERRAHRPPRERREPRDPTALPLDPSKRGYMKRPERKPMPRRNSDTSVVEVNDEVRKAKDRAEMEKEARSKDPRSRDPRYRRPGKSSRRVDLIDKLDVTSIYGPGLFHHDGPFDAANPQRNRKGGRAAPMAAFAEDSANNSIGGSGPVNKQIDYDTFHGRGAEGFTDYNDSSYAADAYPGFRRGGNVLGVKRGERRADVNIMDPKARSQFVVGDDSAGLGTSTFFEGTSAPRSAMQRREPEPDTQAGAAALQRKKSLAQKIRGGMSMQRPGGDSNGSITSPEPRYIDPQTGKVISPSSPQFVQSAGGRGGVYEVNPFFVEADLPPAEEPKKIETATQIKVADPDQEAFTTVSRARTASSPNRGLARTTTGDAAPTSPGTEGKASGGFLNRVKSLKGNKKTRPDRSGSASQVP